VRANKLRTLWDSLPSLPDVHGDTPTDLQRMKLPGQDTHTTLSPERADRLRKLYDEELVRRVRQERPQARLWGGADDLLPDNAAGREAAASKGVAWTDFRWVDEPHQSLGKQC
jgi:solute carrier family 25 phosphate transporter 23/24/25/41